MEEDDMELNVCRFLWMVVIVLLVLVIMAVMSEKQRQMGSWSIMW